MLERQVGFSNIHSRTDLLKWINQMYNLTIDTIIRSRQLFLLSKGFLEVDGIAFYLLLWWFYIVWTMPQAGFL